jgi:2-polyprenyl-6-methoxyphenol hydroxylase-like FAD-dependent oxidoreductase
VPDAPRVLIAGAGPVGLAAALRLAQGGVPVVVLEKRMQLGRALHAFAWLPPTLEAFAQLGILGGLLRTGLRARRIVCLRTGRPAPLARFDLGLLAGVTRFPFRLHLDRGSVAAALAAGLAAYPHVRLAFDAELVRVDQDEAGVAVRVRSALGERVERGAYLLAADGAASAARASLGIGLDGAAVTGRLLEVLTPTDLSDLVPGAEAATWIQTAGGCCALTRLPDLWQIAMPLPGGESDAAALDEPALRARLAGLLPFGAATLPLVAREVRPVRRQIASAFAAGRVLLAGDAAHLVQTRFGLNMNCGIHDALAAAEALIAALHTPAAAGYLLARYAGERRLIASAGLLPYADRAIPGAETWADELAAAAADPARARAWLRGICMLDVPGLRATTAEPALVC